MRIQEEPKGRKKKCRTKTKTSSEHIRTFHPGSNSTLGQMDDKWLKWSPVIQ